MCQVFWSVSQGFWCVCQVLIVLVCLLSFWSITFLVMELLSFAVEMAVYTFIGVIVTADVTSRYLSVIFFLLLYGHG